MKNQVSESVTFLKHIVFDLFSLILLLLKIFIQFLLLKQSVGARMNPVLNRIDVNTVGLIILLLFLSASVGVFFRLLLQRLKLLDLLAHLLIGLLKIILQFEDCLVLILNTLFITDQIFVDIRFEL